VLHAATAVIVSVLVSGFYSWNLNNSEVLAMFLARDGLRLCGYVAGVRLRFFRHSLNGSVGDG
jgi:hypothetical protein